MAKTWNEIFDELKETKAKVEIDGEQYWLAEGDLLMDEEDLKNHAIDLAAVGEADPEVLAEERKGLVGIVDDDGKIVRWARGLMLTYAVLKDSFANNQHYKDVVKYLAQATQDWERTCGVNFQHLSAWDKGDAPGEEVPLFVVMGHNSGGKWVALSFFPYHASYRRRLLIDPTFFGDHDYSKVGILRHELGHMLGFRHEHIVSGAPAICPDEPLGNTIQLTDYDPKSVMHYFCGGVGSKKMEISDLDADGARTVYGPPDHEIHQVT